MTTSPAAAERPAAALTASTFLDIHHATVQAFTQDAVGDADTDREKARRLFAEALEKLAEDCAADGVYEFFYVAAPLKIHRATGAPSETPET